MNISNNTYIFTSFVDDKKMRELNKKYKGKDSTTDVLSFEINEKMEDGRIYLGDIIINIDQAKRQAGEQNTKLEEEISELTKHATLHLLGIHHN